MRTRLSGGVVEGERESRPYPIGQTRDIYYPPDTLVTVVNK